MISRRGLFRLAGSGFIVACAPSALMALAPPKKFQGEEIFARLVRTAKEHEWSNMPIGQLVGEVGMALVDTPYVGGTLEIDDDVETCLVNLGALDCVTFYEAALGFARMLKTKGKPSIDAMLAQVESMRYRGGHNGGYLTRLHYTSDYLFDNDKRGIMKLVSPHLPGAERMDKPFDFMSTHANSYRQLKAHPEWVPKLAEMEKVWSARKPFYLPKDITPMVESLLETGDVLGIATSAAGLDTSHTGLCYRDTEGALRLLHASSAHHKVELGPRLSEYLESVKKDIGIMVARPMEPR